MNRTTNQLKKDIEVGKIAIHDLEDMIQVVYARKTASKKGSAEYDAMRISSELLAESVNTVRKRIADALSGAVTLDKEQQEREELEASIHDIGTEARGVGE